MEDTMLYTHVSPFEGFGVHLSEFQAEGEEVLVGVVWERMACLGYHVRTVHIIGDLRNTTH